MILLDLLDYTFNKYNNTVHRTIKMKPVDVKLILMLNTMKILTIKILNLKLVNMLEYQNTKTFLLKDILQIGQKFLAPNWSEVFVVSKIKNAVP